MTFKKNKPLSKNENLVFEVIKKSKKPSKAYTILSEVQKKGLKAPPQVYRALDKLIELGLVHKIESQNAYLNCKDVSCSKFSGTIFSICNQCHDVSEMKNDNIKKYLSFIKSPSGQKCETYKLELYGTCQKCKS